VEIYKTTGTGINWPWVLICLAETYDIAGDLPQALKASREALSAVTETGEGRDEAEVHRLMGALALRRKAGASRIQNKSQAEQYFRKAIEVARNQSAKSCELRATTSLAGLLRDTGRYDEARAALTEVYHGFTEGFETSDMKDVRVLLHELSNPPSRRP
jgi:predicted ATPase